MSFCLGYELDLNIANDFDLTSLKIRVVIEAIPGK
jgi:hypothetical protein